MKDHAEDRKIGVKHETMTEEVTEAKVQATRSVLWDLAEPTSKTILKEGERQQSHQTPYGTVLFTRTPDGVEARAENTKVESYLRYVLGHTGDDIEAGVPGWQFMREMEDGEVLLRVARAQLYTTLI